MPVQPASIPVLAESGLQDVAAAPAESVGDEIDGFGGSGSDADIVRSDAEALSQSRFESVRLRLRVIADYGHTGGQMLLQRREVHMTIHVRAEISPDRPVEPVCVVSVSDNHRLPFKMS